MGKKIRVIEARIEELEGISVDVLIEFLLDREPIQPLVERARVAQGSFATIQRRRSAENQREALAFMMHKEGMEPRTPRSLPASSAGAATS